MFNYFPYLSQPQQSQQDDSQFGMNPFGFNFQPQQPVQFPTITPQTVQNFMSQVNPVYTKQQPYNALVPMEMYRDYKKGLLNMGDK